jgi:mono/diheme cytochrome c family protein
MTARQFCAGALLGLSVLIGCGEKGEGKKADVQRGRAVYMTTCINCHNPDPKKDGSVGPAVWGASWALLRARVVKGEYPPGYVPKRKTRLMTPLPHLEKDILALHAFLNQ